MIRKKYLLANYEALRSRIGDLQREINELKNSQTFYLDVVDFSGKPPLPTPITPYSPPNPQDDEIPNPSGRIYYFNSQTKKRAKTVVEMMIAIMDHLGVEAKIVESRSDIIIKTRDPKKEENKNV